MKTFTVVNEAGHVFRVVEIIAGEISKLERKGTYYNVVEDVIVETNEVIL